ncbi:hypothetical protein B0G69_1776 [Paraburkholderia sp. RAU2J]|nr:hypothetical protein B0G69_1776 [Paraburkholderia sp. RAU2J]
MKKTGVGAQYRIACGGQRSPVVHGRLRSLPALHAPRRRYPAAPNSFIAGTKS